ncbi:MAG: protein-disulfide reductase DsbD domain-containing protein, partial [Casimicrobium sp.]
MNARWFEHTLHLFRKWIPAFAGMTALVGAFLLSTGYAAPIKTPHAEVDLVVADSALVPGQTSRIALSIKHAPHWHTYWKNPGDSGYPTKVTWELPAGYAVSEFDWPVPARLRTGPIVNFGYENEVWLPATLTVPKDANVGASVTIKGKAEWLVCKDVCIPEEGVVSMTLPVAASANKVNADAWRNAEARIPKALDGWRGEALVNAREMTLLLTPPANAPKLTRFDVFPEVEQITDPSVQKVYATPNGYAAQLKLVDG